MHTTLTAFLLTPALLLRCWRYLGVFACHILMLALSQPGYGQSDLQFQIFTGPRSIDGAGPGMVNETPTDPTSMLAAAVMDRAGIDYQMSVTNWSRAVQTVQSTANVMVYSMIRNPDREELYHWIGQIRPIETYLFAMTGKLENPPSTLEEARHLSTGAARSSASAEFLTNFGFENLYYLGDHTRAPLMLERERIDLAAFSLAEARGLELSENLAPGSLIPLIRIEELSSGTYFVVSKQTDIALVERLKQAYDELVENGDYQRIMNPDATLD